MPPESISSPSNGTSQSAHTAIVTFSDGDGTIIKRYELAYEDGLLMNPEVLDDKPVEAPEEKSEEIVRPAGQPPMFMPDGTANPEFKEWQRRNIHFASLEVCEVSGIDENVPTAIGKLCLKNMDDKFRHITPRLNLLLHVPLHAKIYTEKNGQGLTYYRLKVDLHRYSDKRRNQMSIYLGTDPRIKKWAEEILEERRQGTEPLRIKKTDYKRIQPLKMMLRRAKRVADGIARKAGFWFNGYYLVEKNHE
ncbi:MAG: hypothetical protein WC299_06190 [Kiritimatiellia bacterium]